jgi:hypothetical protein
MAIFGNCCKGTKVSGFDLPEPLYYQSRNCIQRQTKAMENWHTQNSQAMLNQVYEMTGSTRPLGKACHLQLHRESRSCGQPLHKTQLNSREQQSLSLAYFGTAELL